MSSLTRIAAAVLALAIAGAPTSAEACLIRCEAPITATSAAAQTAEPSCHHAATPPGAQGMMLVSLCAHPHVAVIELTAGGIVSKLTLADCPANEGRVPALSSTEIAIARHAFHPGAIHALADARPISLPLRV